MKKSFKPNHYPKAQAFKEGMTKRSLTRKAKDIISINKENSEVITTDVSGYIQGLHAGTFSCSIAQPIIHDLIALVCTHAQELVQKRGKDDTDFHYKIEMSYDNFKQIALGKEGMHWAWKLNAELRKETHRSLIGNKNGKVLVLARDIDIILDLQLKNEKARRRISGLRGFQDSKSTDIKTVHLYFFKSLWKDLFSGKKSKIGNNMVGDKWCPIPNRFQVFIENSILAIKRGLNDPNIDDPCLESIRKDAGLWLLHPHPTGVEIRGFFNLISIKANEYKKRFRIPVDAIEMAEWCRPDLLVTRKGITSLKIWNSTLVFVKQIIATLDYMMLKEHMQGIPFILTGVEDDCKNKQFTITIARNNPKKGQICNKYLRQAV